LGQGSRGWGGSGFRKEGGGQGERRERDIKKLQGKERSGTLDTVIMTVMSFFPLFGWEASLLLPKVRAVPVEECDACIDTFSVDHNRLMHEGYHDDAYYGRKSEVAANPSHLSHLLFFFVLFFLSSSAKNVSPPFPSSSLQISKDASLSTKKKKNK
jgi:hypothetical protein